MNFKKGDLIRHKPTGCVGIFIDTHLCMANIKFIGTSPKEFWEIKDCELYNDPTDVVDAAEQLCSNIGHCYIGSALRESLNKCNNAIDKYKSKINLEPEYKWLCQNVDNKQINICTNKPCEYVDDGWWFNGFSDFKELTENISWLKPGQLWQAVDKLLVPKLRRIGIELNQYKNICWQLIEDHSQNCDNCNHLRTCGMNEVSYPIEYCRKADTFKPHYGMNGCKWEKSDNE